MCKSLLDTNRVNKTMAMTRGAREYMANILPNLSPSVLIRVVYKISCRTRSFKSNLKVKPSLLYDFAMEIFKHLKDNSNKLMYPPNYNKNKIFFFRKRLLI